MPSAEKDTGCEIYDEPGQTCATAGPAVIAAEGACGPCVAALLAEAWRAGAQEGFGAPSDWNLHQAYALNPYILPPGGSDA